jgi:hypothetical protein
MSERRGVSDKKETGTDVGLLDRLQAEQQKRFPLPLFQL